MFSIGTAVYVPIYFVNVVSEIDLTYLIRKCQLYSICIFDWRIIRNLRVSIEFETSLTFVLWIQALCPFSDRPIVN